MSKKPNIDKVLSFVSFISLAGDFLSLFSIIYLTQKIFNNVALSAYNIAISSLAVAFSGLILPAVMSRFTQKKILFTSQLFSFLSILLLLILYSRNLITHPIHLYALLFFKGVMYELFEATKENLSNSANTNETHSNSISKLLTSVFGAQFVGPILAVIIIKLLGIKYALAIDAITFLLGAYLLRNLVENKTLKQHKLRFPTHLWKKTNFRKVTLIRYVLIFAPIAIYNMAIIQYYRDHLEMTVVDTAFNYSLLGVGAALALMSIKKNIKADIKSEKWFCFIGLVIMSSTALFMTLSHNKFVVFTVILMSGVGMGFNALGSQTIRRKVMDKDSFVNFISCELFISQCFDFVFASIATYMLASNKITYIQALYIVTIFYAALAIYHLTYKDDPEALT